MKVHPSQKRQVSSDEFVWIVFPLVVGLFSSVKKKSMRIPESSSYWVTLVLTLSWIKSLTGERQFEQWDIFHLNHKEMMKPVLSM